MKLIRLIFFLLLTIQTAFAEKRAIIIAIGDYPEKSGIRKLHNIGNDIPLVKNTLLNQGFKPENILVLKDVQATKAGVTKAFSDLVSRSAAGDNVVITFSSHGQQVQDDNGDELDGFDETVPCYDAEGAFSRTYHAQNHLRDDEINIFLNQLRTKIGTKGDVLMLVDCCHSGSITRGTEQVRGIAENFTMPDYKPVERNEKTESATGFVKVKSPSIPNDESNMASLVVISAAKSTEPNTETRDKVRDVPCGSLSYAFSRSMPALRKGATYRDLFGKILAEITSFKVRQTPVVEGNGTDRQLFGGDYLPRPQYFGITRLFKKDTVEINGGTLCGIFKGTKLSFFKSSDGIKVKPFRTGVVVAEDNFNSKVLLDTGSNKIDTGNRKIMQALVTEKSFGNYSIQLFMEDNVTSALRDTLKNFELVKVTADKKKANLLLIQNGNTVTLALASSGETINEIQNVSITQVKESLRRYAQSKLIKELKLDNFLMAADVQVTPIPASLQSTGKIDSALVRERKQSGILSVKANKEALRLTITNEGAKTFYVNILDISPDGSIAPVFPKSELDPSEYKVTPSRSLTKEFVVSPPFGNEFLKIVLTEEDINLGVVIGSNGAQSSTRGVSSSVEQLFRKSFNIAGTRGTVSPMSGLDNASTIDYTFKIIE